MPPYKIFFSACICAELALELSACLGPPRSCCRAVPLVRLPSGRGVCPGFVVRLVVRCVSALYCAEDIERGQPSSLCRAAASGSLVCLMALCHSLCQHLFDVVLQPLAELFVYLLLYEWLHLFVFNHLRHAQCLNALDRVAL